jgi:CRISPR-associated protein Cmr5
MTRDQERADSAFNRVTQFGNINPSPETKTKYGSMAHKLPVLIRTAGLAQALVFVEARGDENHRKLLDDIAITAKCRDRVELLEKSRTTELMEYMTLTREILAVCLWYKRFGSSVLDADPAADTRSE